MYFFLNEKLCQRYVQLYSIDSAKLTYENESISEYIVQYVLYPSRNLTYMQILVVIQLNDEYSLNLTQILLITTM